MPADQRLDRIETNLEKTTQAQARTEANLDRLTQVVSTIATSVAAHHEQIEGILKVAEVQKPANGQANPAVGATPARVASLPAHHPPGPVTACMTSGPTFLAS